MNRIVIVSGPACVGKGPLLAAVDHFNKEIKYDSIPVIKSFESRGGRPRPDEERLWRNPDYWRSQHEIMQLASDRRYLVGDCHGFPQALDLYKFRDAQSDLVILEIVHTIGRQLQSAGILRDVELASVFLSPVSLDEIYYLRACDVCPAHYIKGLMVLKQINRAHFQGKRIDHVMLVDIHRRAADAIEEMKSIPEYKHVIVNPSGEGSSDWKRSPDGKFFAQPEGGAAHTLDAFLKIVSGQCVDHDQLWPFGFI